jgi:hypothetical protein
MPIFLPPIWRCLFEKIELFSARFGDLVHVLFPFDYFINLFFCAKMASNHPGCNSFDRQSPVNFNFVATLVTYRHYFFSLAGGRQDSTADPNVHHPSSHGAKQICQYEARGGQPPGNSGRLEGVYHCKAEAEHVRRATSVVESLQGEVEARLRVTVTAGRVESTLCAVKSLQRGKGICQKMVELRKTRSIPTYLSLTLLLCLSA